MRMFKIILSKEENYIGSALKLKKESLIDTEIIYMEEIIANKQINIFSRNDIVYFLSNNNLIASVIKYIEPTGCYIINKNFLLSNYKKDEVQNLLKNNGIQVPNIILYNKLEEDKFPVFCKENRHTGITFQAYNRFTIDEFFSKFDVKKFYLEEVIQSNISEPYKIYFVFGKVFGKSNETRINYKIKEICHKISNSLKNIEAFSIDVIKSLDSYYVIDLNLASGFYLSDKGRKEFLNTIKDIENKVDIAV